MKEFFLRFVLILMLVVLNGCSDTETKIENNKTDDNKAEEIELVINGNYIENPIERYGLCRLDKNLNPVEQQERISSPLFTPEDYTYYISIKGLFENFNYKIKWNSKKHEATIQMRGNLLHIKEGYDRIIIENSMRTYEYDYVHMEIEDCYEGINLFEPGYNAFVKDGELMVPFSMFYGMFEYRSDKKAIFPNNNYISYAYGESYRGLVEMYSRIPGASIIHIMDLKGPSPCNVRIPTASEQPNSVAYGNGTFLPYYSDYARKDIKFSIWDKMNLKLIGYTNNGFPYYILMTDFYKEKIKTFGKISDNFIREIYVKFDNGCFRMYELPSESYKLFLD